MNIESRRKGACVGCGACMLSCPRQCISMKADTEGFSYPHVETIDCINCGLCIQKCPLEVRKSGTEGDFPLCYAAYNLNEEIRKCSSSGGIFTPMAEHILEKGGIVYGAAFDDSLLVRHIRVSDSSELNRLRTSKYVQSDLGDCYQRVKSDLSMGYYVLFTGTPCQVAGLYSFLGEIPERLLTADTVCMGVPSPQIFRQYLSEMKKLHGASVCSVNFRTKSPSWQGYQIRVDFSNGKEYLCNRKQDDYMLAFSSKYTLRPSCYQCKFKSIHHESDITLGDFWGIETVCPEMHDDRGTSMVLIHSNRGEKVFEAISSKMKIKSIDVTTIQSCNPYLVESVAPPLNRDSFWRCCFKKGLKKAVSSYARASLLSRVWNAFRQFAHKVKVLCFSILRKEEEK